MFTCELIYLIVFGDEVYIYVHVNPVIPKLKTKLWSVLMVVLGWYKCIFAIFLNFSTYRNFLPTV